MGWKSPFFTDPSSRTSTRLDSSWFSRNSTNMGPFKKHPRVDRLLSWSFYRFTVWVLSVLHGSHHYLNLKLTVCAPENGWLEDDPFLLGFGLFSGVLAVSFRQYKRFFFFFRSFESQNPWSDAILISWSLIRLKKGVFGCQLWGDQTIQCKSMVNFEEFSL